MSAQKGQYPALNLIVGAALGTIVLALALISLFWTPGDPFKLDIIHRLAEPSALYPFGSDEFGRDVLSRIMLGGGTSILLAAGTVICATTVGTPLGLIAGFYRGWLDRILMMLNDALLAFPGILLALGLVSLIGPGTTGIVVALSVAYTPKVIRIVRGSVISLREREFIEASRALGNGSGFTILRHVLPNTLTPIAVFATSMFGWAILVESALSFLGLGVPPPAPTWGNMLAAARPYLDSAPWLSVFPGLFIAMTLLSVNLLGDALRDLLDPRTAS